MSNTFYAVGGLLFCLDCEIVALGVAEREINLSS